MLSGGCRLPVDRLVVRRQYRHYFYLGHGRILHMGYPGYRCQMLSIHSAIVYDNGQMLASGCYLAYDIFIMDMLLAARLPLAARDC